MTEFQHPITPPPKLVQQWMHQLLFSGIPHPDHGSMDLQPHWMALVELAANYGADQELEACCQWISDDAEALRIVRRPKPPSLAEEAIAALNEIEDRMLGPTNQEKLIRRALERLQQLEDQQ